MSEVLICGSCGGSASLPLGMSCSDHRPRLVPEHPTPKVMAKILDERDFFKKNQNDLTAQVVRLRGVIRANLRLWRSGLERMERDSTEVLS